MERTGLVRLKSLGKKKKSITKRLVINYPTNPLLDGQKKNTLTFQKKLKTKNKFLIFSAEISTDKNYFAWMQSFLG